MSMQPSSPIRTFGSVYRSGREQPEYQADRLRKLCDEIEHLVGAYARQMEDQQHKAHQVWQDNLWLKDQLTNWRVMAEQAEKTILEQHENIEEMEKAKTWLDHQRASWQHLAEQAERTTLDLQDRINELEKQNAVLANDKADNDHESSQSLARLTELQQWAETLNTAFEARGRRIEELERQLRGKSETADILWNQLQSIHQSTGWAVLQKMYAVRFFLIPRDSWRERLGRMLAHAIRQLRYHMRRGENATSLSGNVRSPELPTTTNSDAQTSMISSACDPTDSLIALEIPGLVSVILPVYNQADLLRSSIDSVLAQTYPNFELIVVNDGSSDDVGSVLREYVGNPKVRVLTQPNQKLPKTLSNGFEFARGEFWTWTSADNLMEPAQLERQVDFLRRHPDVAMVYADYLAIDDRGNPLADPTWRAHNRHRPDSPEIHLPHDPRPLNTVEDNFIGPCFMYRAWAGQLVGEYAPEFGLEDYDYWMRINRLFKIAHLDSDEALYRYRVHDNTISAQAVELKIGQRVASLMDRERQRRDYQSQPWTVFSDAATTCWLNKIDRGTNIIRAMTDLNTTSAGKGMVIVSAESLADLPRDLTNQKCVAAWFGATPELPYQCRAALRESVDICFCDDTRIAARVGLFHPRVVAGTPGQVLFDRIIAFADNHAFYRDTVPVNSRARRLPEPFRHPGHRPRVLVQVNSFTCGGMERVVLDLLAVLGKSDFDPLLAILGEAGPAAETAKQVGYEVLTLPGNNRDNQYRALLKDRGIELINAHFSPYGAAIAAELKIPYVQTIHSCYVSIPPEQVAAYRNQDALTTAYLCTSGNTACYADLKLGLSPEKMLITPNGIDPDRLKVGDRAATRRALREKYNLGYDSFVFLHVGSIYRDKAQKLLVNALAEVIKTCPKAKLVLLGGTMEEAYLKEVEQEIRDTGLDDAVVFAGFHEDVAPFYAMADAFVLPSFWEGWSLSLAEAMYMNLPVIATAVGSAPDLLPMVGGHLIRPPYDSVLDLSVSTLSKYLFGDHSRLISDLAAAMKSVYAGSSQPKVCEEFIRSLDYLNAYGRHARLFAWLLQGGDITGGRPWLLADGTRDH